MSEVELQPLICDYCPNTIPDWPVIYIGDKRVCKNCFEELRGE